MCSRAITVCLVVFIGVAQQAHATGRGGGNGAALTKKTWKVLKKPLSLAEKGRQRVIDRVLKVGFPTLSQQELKVRHKEWKRRIKNWNGTELYETVKKMADSDEEIDRRNIAAIMKLPPLDLLRFLRKVSGPAIKDPHNDADDEMFWQQPDR